MYKEIIIEEYLKQYLSLPTIDVRAPVEYDKGHIPGAGNVPLFSNEERAHIGTVYKQRSRDEAFSLAYKYVEPRMDSYISDSRKVAPEGKVVVHCWRGGMRSRSFANHLASNGFKEVSVIKNGYKAFRGYAQKAFARDFQLNVLGGYTGSGKTRILRHLKDLGQQVIDLEGLARHKGSAFGGIGQFAQPTVEQFENDLFWIWKDIDFTKPVWMEDESLSIGAVNLPLDLFRKIRQSPVYFLDIPKTERARHLVTEYAACNTSELAAAILRISKRLGGDNVKKALECLEKKDFYEVAMITLQYYDKFYLKGISNRDQKLVYRIELKDTNNKQNAEIILNHFEIHKNGHGKINAI